MKKKAAVLSAAVILALTGCGSNAAHDTPSKPSMNQMHMNHSGSAEVPAGLKKAVNPAYKPGSRVLVKADHMEGMKGSEATVSGAFDTTVYSVTYTPTTGGDPVKNHKWVIHEEIKGAGKEPFKSGDKVTLMADHMEGMKGAEAEIDTAQKTTVYMIDYTPTTGGKKVKNHKWVIERELSAK
ncbi:YdhK family protein [Peribacillus kribbensis]|uniref:YdhK family protein n=1 Tax=Peribacillus kribbensis TaxID=356658 RepID=UPI0003FFB859|nr:YdhK family protein [Peribacillus kribbensis]